MILVLCLNAGVDRTYEVQGFQVGRFHRPARALVGAGGKGINVARVLQGLGHAVTVAGFAGGYSGAFLAQDLKRARIRALLTRIREESRTTLAVVDTGSKLVTRLDEAGPLVSPGEVDALRQSWRELLAEAEVAVISGNPPRGVPRELFEWLVKRARNERVPVLVDAHDEALQAAVEGQPDLITPNHSELSWLARRPLSVPAGVVEFSRGLVARGVGRVLTTLGEHGAVMVGQEGEPLQATPPDVETVSTVGAGDAALAGYVAATVEGKGPQERLRWTVAAGTANCLELGAASCRRASVEELAPLVKITPAA